jgi:hypothetical protein
MRTLIAGGSTEGENGGKFKFMALLLASEDSYQTFAKIHCPTEVNAGSKQAKESSKWYLKMKIMTKKETKM